MVATATKIKANVLSKRVVVNRSSMYSGYLPQQISITVDELGHNLLVGGTVRKAMAKLGMRTMSPKMQRTALETVPNQVTLVEVRGRWELHHGTQRRWINAILKRYKA